MRGALDHLREQLAGPAHEGEPLRIFVGAGAFAHENQLGLLVARAENDFGAALMQAAAGAIADVFPDEGEGIAGSAC